LAIYIELTTDAFENNFRKQLNSMQAGGSGNTTSRAGKSSARRPLRGIEIKEDTYALLKVVRADNSEIPLIDSSSATGRSNGGYTNFIIQTIQDSRMEKHQIVETFGDNYIFFFGENPRFVDVQAIVLNTHDFNWRAEWWENYDRYMRGSKLAELGARLYLFYDDIILEGYMVHCSAQEGADRPYHVNLQFKIFVTNYQNISSVGNPNFPTRSSIVLPEDVSLTNPNAAGELASAYLGAAWEQVSAENAGRKFDDLDDAGLLGGDTPQANPLTSERRITKIIQSVSPSYAISQGYWDFLAQHGDVAAIKNAYNLILRTGNPLRALISDNLDEYAGGGDPFPHPALGLGSDDRAPSALAGTVRREFEVLDLFYEAVQFLTCFGADIDNPSALNDVGLGPSFSPTGPSFGAVADNNSSIFEASASIGVTSSFDAFAQDPLSNVFGSSLSVSTKLSKNRARYTEGAGDPLYGYPSDFAKGPGFGQTGFGDLGGTGGGSALGPSGDPGFKDPDHFTDAGVSEEQGAFDRFMRPKEDATAITPVDKPGSFSWSSSDGGASKSVAGLSSAFSLISVPGILNSEGTSRQDADSIAAKQAKQKFGFSANNPYGVMCPEPAPKKEEEDSFFDGFNYTYP